MKGDGSSLDKDAPGYSAPLGPENSSILTDESLIAMDVADRASAPRGRGRGRGRGGRGRGGYRRRGRGYRGGFGGRTDNFANGSSHHENTAEVAEEEIAGNGST